MRLKSCGSFVAALAGAAGKTSPPRRSYDRHTTAFCCRGWTLSTPSTRGLQGRHCFFPAPLKSEKRRRAMKSLLFITGDRPIGRMQEPVAWTLRRPSKSFVRTDPLQRPCDIVWIVACKTKFGARLHHAGQRIKRLRLDKPPFVMALLRPRIGKKKEHPSQRCIRQRLDDIARISGVQADS